LIPRLNPPGNGRIWSDEKPLSYLAWLWKSPATETLAEAEWFPVRRPRRSGSAPISAWSASTNRSRSAPRCHRLHYGRGRDRRPRRPLVSLRPHLQRRGRYRAGPIDQAGFGLIAQDLKRFGRSARTPRMGIQRHSHGGAHARHSRRAITLWLQDRQLVFRNTTQHCAL